jgi:hypothetical protein
MRRDLGAQRSDDSIPRLVAQVANPGDRGLPGPLRDLSGSSGNLDGAITRASRSLANPLTRPTPDSR